jgi:hypothetical protein
MRIETGWIDISLVEGNPGDAELTIRAFKKMLLSIRTNG